MASSLRRPLQLPCLRWQGELCRGRRTLRRSRLLLLWSLLPSALLCLLLCLLWQKGSVGRGNKLLPLLLLLRGMVQHTRL